MHANAIAQDSFAAFSMTQGASNFYYYRYDSVTETYASLVANTTANRWQKSLSPNIDYPQIGHGWMSPGGEDSPEEVVLGWRASSSGTAAITLSSSGTTIDFTTAALPAPDWPDDGVRLSIRRNRMTLWSAVLPRPGSPITLPSLSVAVNAGDELYFHVDRYGGPYNDHVRFLPVITLTAGSGYTDPAITYDSSTGFSSTTGPWYYLGVPQGQGGQFNPASPSPYIPMVYQTPSSPAVPYWAWISGSTVTWARVYATQLHPETTHDSVRAWIAPSAGDVYLETVIPIAMAYVQVAPADGAVVSIHHNATLVWTKTLDRTDTTGESLKRRLHVLAGDSITLRVSSGASQINFGDHVNFHVALKLVPGENSVASFSGTAGGNWSYRARNLTSGTYSAMTYNSSTSAWEFGTSSVARVYANRQVPAPGVAAVRTWQAPIDCVAHVDTRVYAKQSSAAISGEDGVNVSVLRNDEVMLTERVAADDLTGVPVTVRVPMRAGQMLNLAVDDGVAGDITGDDVTLDYTVTPYVNGAPRRADGPTIDIVGTGTPKVLNVTQPTSWSWGTYRVQGSIDLSAGAFLDVRDAVVEFQNTEQREFNLNWKSGRLATAGVLIGGRLDPSGYMMHSNFEIRQGTWYCTDSMLRYHYGVLPGDPYAQPSATAGAFRATRVVRGPSCGELILRGDGSSKLVDSTFQVNLNAHLTGTAASAGYNYDLMIDRAVGVSTPVTFGATGTVQIPGAFHELRIERTLVPWWFFFPSEVKTASPPGPWVFRFNPSRRSSMLPNFTSDDLHGGYRLPTLDGTSTTPVAVMVGNCTQEFTQTRTSIWGMYFNGSNTNAVMLGDVDATISSTTNHIGEFMVFGGRVQYRSSSSTQRDALSGCTTMEIGGWWSGAPTVNTTMKWVNLGIANGQRGQIKVRAGSTLNVEDCNVSNVDVYVESGGTLLDTRSTWSNVAWRAGSPTSASGYEAVHRWDFTSSREGWENWGQNTSPWFEQGFQEPWNTYSGEMQLNYPSIPSGGWTAPGGTPTAAHPLFHPRMVAPMQPISPSGVRPLYAMNLEHCYLVLRVMPKVSNTTTPIRVVVSATDNEAGWSSWGLYERQFDIAATPVWATYVVDLNAAPGTPAHSRLTPHTANTGWQPLSGRTNYLGIQLGTYAQNGYLNAPDRIDVDYVIVTDDFTPY